MVVEPIEDASNFMEAENYPTLSYYIPVVLVLLQILSDDDSMSNEGKQISNLLKGTIKSRLVS